MSFDLPALLSEYMLPLLLLVPLAIVVVLIAARSNKDDHWSHSRHDLLGPGTARTSLPSVRPDLPRTPMPSPYAVAPAPVPVAPPVKPPAPAVEPPAAEAPEALNGSDSSLDDSHLPTEPMDLGPPVTPYLSPAAPAAPLLREVTPPTDAPLRRRASDAPPEETADAALTLPRRRASDRADAPDAPASGSAQTPILIVDDSAVVRAKLGKLLTSNGYAVTAARHGNEALEAIGQQWFAVMITDLEMPEMDGFELIAHVSGDLRTENLPIVAITGHESLQAKVHDAKGLYGIFKKPWNDRELLQRVAALSVLRPRG
jgi:CheY-like chemotaxis protein